MNASESQIENVVFQALAHPLKREMLKLIASRAEGLSYTELINEMSLSTGKLNYHLEQLGGLIEKNIERRYALTPFGMKALDQLNLIKHKITPDDEKYLKIAESAQKSSLQPAVKSFLLLGIVFSALFLTIWSYIAYIAVTEGAPAIVYVTLPVLMTAGIGLLGSLVFAFKKTPEWVRRFERRYFSP